MAVNIAQSPGNPVTRTEFLREMIWLLSGLTLVGTLAAVAVAYWERGR